MPELLQSWNSGIIIPDFLYVGFGTKVRPDALGCPTFIGKMEEGAMWISLFIVACGAAVCLSVAAVMMQPATRRSLHS